jgi:hypothetical protein
MTKTLVATDPGAEGWWSPLDTAILGCPARGGPMASTETGRRLYLSDGVVSSFLSMLVQERKINIKLVDRTGGTS